MTHTHPPRRSRAWLPTLAAAALLLACGAAARAATYTVTDNSDNSADTGSIRYAVNAVNGGAGTGDTINFQTPLTGGSTITLTGGALALSKPVTVNGAGVTIDGNSSSGVITVGSRVTLSGLTLQHSFSFNGGGVSVAGGATATVIRCTFSSNFADNGGGLYNSGTAVVTDCTFVNNQTEEGAGLYNTGTATVTDCAFINNNGLANGGGLYSAAGTLAVTGCTLTDNQGGVGGGLYSNGGTTTLLNDIVYNDSGGEVNINGGAAAASYCDIGEPLGNSGDGVTDNGGNQDDDPGFVSSTDLAPAAAASPIVSQGLPLTGHTYDLAGVPRFSPPCIGAYEFVAATAVVEIAAASGSGSLAAALSSAGDYTEVVFDPIAFATMQTITPGATLTVNNHVAIVGPAAGVAVDGNGKYQVIAVNSGGLSAIGLTVQHGSVSGNFGGGLYNDSDGTVTLTGCAFVGNSAADGGGGLANGGTLTLTGCDFVGNTTTNVGGGLANFRTATLSGCAFVGNTASGNGGGMTNVFDTTATLTGCTFVGNSAGGSGGGLFNRQTATLTGCTLTGNSGGGGGGGLFSNSGTLSLDSDIVYGDTGGEVSITGGAVSASYCDIGEPLGNSGDGVADDGSNQDALPLFVTPYTSSTAPFNLELQAASPCLGTGDPAVAGTPDFNGYPRPAAPAVGAFQLTYALSGVPVSTTIGTAFTNVTLATGTLTDPQPSLSISINWGDNTPLDTTTGAANFGSGGALTVTGSHTYAACGSYPVTVTVTDSALPVALPAGLQTATITTTANVGPVAPTTLTATANGTSQTVLSWTASTTPGVFYYVYRGTSPGGESAQEIAHLIYGQTTFTDPSPDYGSTNYYVVRAFKGGGLSAATDEASAAATLVAPPAPTGLAARAHAGSVFLSWTAPAGPVSGYNVFRSTTSGQEDPTTATPLNGATPVTALTYTDSTATNGQTYYYQVVAVNTAGASTASNEASATPEAAPTAPTVTPTPGNALVSLSWTSAGSGVTYRVLRGTSPGAEAAISSALTGTAFKDSGAVNGTPYYYKVVATNVGGTATSPEVSATPVINAPVLNTLKAVGNGLKLGWTAPPGKVTSYTVSRGPSPGQETTLAGGLTSPLYTDTSAVVGTTYYYTVTALNGAASSAPSNEKSGKR